VDAGVDVGGTFTDFVGFRGRAVVTAKLESTGDPSVAVVEGLRELGASRMAHGTTIATNAILQRRGATTALVTTSGFEDLLAIGRQHRPSLYDLHVTRPLPVVARERSFGARERIDARGRVVRPLSDREVQRVVRLVRATGAESVAVCLLFSFLRPQHERRLASALRGYSVSVSSEVLAEFREYERASTTALDAYIKPLVTRYLADLEKAVPRGFYVMKSGGGVAQHATVAQRPVEMVLSGPAGGVAAAAVVARALRHKNIVSFDMGGTSADFSAIIDGRPGWTTEASIDGFPLALPVVDIESIGAGGGSLAWRDPGGALRVGPESAGADPGPIAYGKGASRVTLTDADLVAGSLGPSLLGGRIRLRPDLARRGIESLASELRVSVDDATLGVQLVVRANMAKAMRIVLAKWGLDPHDFVLLAFGGAGPMHAVPLARELGVPRVLVPFLPGAFSAYGILISDIRLDYSRSVVRSLEKSRAAIQHVVRELTSRAKTDLRGQGLDPEGAVIEGSADLRFRGQSYEINVPLRGDLASAFRRAHRRRYGYASKDEPIEVVTVRVTSRVPRRPIFPKAPYDVRPRVTSRDVLIEDEWHESPVYARPSLPVGFAAAGPAIVEEDHATTVVPPGALFHIDARGMIDIEVGA